MPESHIKSVRTDDLDINYEVTIKELKESVSFHERELAKLLFVVNFLTPPEERDAVRKHYAKQSAMFKWHMQQLQLQVDHKQLEWKIMTMIRDEKFDGRVKDLFLRKYDDLGLQLIEAWEEGVTLDEMTESDYRESVDDIMRLRNLIRDE
jgi:hypothetical protein